MKVEITGGACVVTREPGDPIFSGIANAKGESRLLYHVKKILNTRGYDLIKKRMAKDGHLVDDMQQYLRSRKPAGDPANCICIYNDQWAIEGADDVLRRNGKVTLRIVTDIFKKKEAHNDKQN